MIGATATATEILKSLVLPGVGFSQLLMEKRLHKKILETTFFLTMNVSINPEVQ